MIDLNWGDFYRDSHGNLQKYFPLHPYQQKALQSKARFTAVIAGSGGGKSCTCPLRLMQWLQQKPDGKFIVVSPNFKMLERTVAKDIRDTFKGTEWAGEYREQKKQYELPTGGIIYLYSADDPESLQGVHADGAVIDEAGLMPEKLWQIVRQRTNLKQAPVYITTTPYNFGWLYKQVYLPWKEGDKDFAVISFPSVANPSFSDEAFKNEQRKLPEWRFKMMYGGEFTKPYGMIYPGMPGCLIDDLPSYDPASVAYVGGIDFGFNDPMAALAGLITGGVLYVIYEKYERFKTVKEFSTSLPNLIEVSGNNVGQVIWFCDNSRPDSIKELARPCAEAGYERHRLIAKPCKKYSGSVADNIDLVNSLIRTGKLKLLRSQVKAILDEADYYTYQPGDTEGEFIDRPVDNHNHALDALAYLCQGAKRKRLLAV